MDSREWIDWDEKYVWHPFTQVKTELSPIPVVKAEGINLYTADGRVIKDMNASWWVNIYGHCHPKIVKAIQDQIAVMDQLVFAGIAHQPASQLSKMLIDFTGKRFDKVFFSDDGSTSVEVALKMALQYFYNKGEGRNKIIALQGAYHGDTFGAMSVGERDYFNRPFERFFFDVDYIELPDDENIQILEKRLENYFKTGLYAAFIFEPLVQGSAGMRMYKEEHLNRLMLLCEKYQVLTIADEVMTGFGRTGKRFACDYLSASPDIMCLSKGITGGSLPLGVTLTHQSIFDAFYHDEKAKAFLHGHSYTGNPLSCAAALATMQVWEEDEIAKKIQRISEKNIEIARKIAVLPFVSNVRCRGTILAFDIKTEENSDYFNPKRDNLYRYFVENGYLIRPLGNTVFLMPPYCVTDEELDATFEVIEKLSL